MSSGRIENDAWLSYPRGQESESAIERERLERLDDSDCIHHAGGIDRDCQLDSALDLCFSRGF